MRVVFPGSESLLTPRRTCYGDLYSSSSCARGERSLGERPGGCPRSS